MLSTTSDAINKTRTEAPASGRPRSIGRPIVAAVLLLLCALAVGLNVRYFGANPVRERISRGMAFASSGKPREAEKEWRGALQADPSNLQPYQLLANLYLEVGEAEKAIPLLERLKTISPKSEHVLCSLADAYTQTGKIKQGMETARQAVIVEPDCAKAHALLGVHLGQGEDTRGAIAELSKAVALAPSDDKIAISFAQAKLDASDFPGAEKVAREVIARSPKYATAWYTLGRSYARRDPTPDNLKTGIDALQHSTELNPLFGDAYAEIGRMKVAAGDYNGAIAALEHVWERGVRSKETAFNLANAYRKVGENAKADKLSAEFKRLSDFNTQYEALQKHLSVEPNNLEVALKLANLEIDAGNLDDATLLLQGILQSLPRDERVLSAAARLYDRMNQPKLATAFRARLAAVKTETKSVRGLQ